MAQPVISVHNVGKRYQLGTGRGHDTLRDHLAHGAKSLFRMVSKSKVSEESGDDGSSFWALKDVSFDLEQGHVLGVVGRNGAGKSTLLKILSQITEPTEGQVKIRGRLASLLEVGTGFHPELSGKDNIYLNGAILGMSKAEISRKFDEIVAFAEVEKFLSTPVKRYSSGMYVRLAFAVAAHLEPEILIVDEVLAVGDAEFQAKCLGKMQEVTRDGGRTVLFVSHNLSTVQKLCTQVVIFDKGRVLGMGETSKMLDMYQGRAVGGLIALGVPISMEGAKRWGGSGVARFTQVLPFSPNGSVVNEAFRQGDLGFRLTLSGDIQQVKAVGVEICDMSGRKIINVNTFEKCEALHFNNSNSVDVIIRNVRLRPGTYKVGFWMGAGETRHIDVITDECVLEVLPPVGRKWISDHSGVVECEFDFNVISA